MKYLNKFSIAGLIGLVAVLAVTATVSADDEEGDIGEAAVVYNVCRTDDGGATYYFVPDVPESELQSSDITDVSSAADCPVAQQEETVEETNEPPPPVDTDGDGINDDVDACPEEAAVNDADQDGCEDPAESTEPVDTDGDGINDDGDQCPDEAAANDANSDGCEDPVEKNDPPADTDGDGVPDDADSCPDVAASVDEDGDGCEDEPAVAAASEEITVQATAYTCADTNFVECETESSQGEEECGDDTFIIKINVTDEGWVVGDTITATEDGITIVINVTNVKDAGEITGFTFTASGGTVIAQVKTGGADDTVGEGEQYFNEANAVSHITFCATGEEEEETGTIIICKVTEPDATANVDFEFTGDLGDFTINTSEANPDCETFDELDLDEEFEVTEEEPTDPWFLTNVSCVVTEGDAGDATIVPADDGATITLLEDGVEVTCTFTNTESDIEGDGPFLCKLETDPPSDQVFTFNVFLEIGEDGPTFEDQVQVEAGGCLLLSEVLDALGATLNGATQVFAVLEEVVPEGWELTAIDCGDVGEQVDLPAVSILFNPQESIPECTFTNVQEEEDLDGPFLCKAETSPASSVEFTFDVSLEIGEGGPVFTGQVTLEAGECITFLELLEELDVDVAIGDQVFAVIEELVPAGWQLTAATCGDVGEDVDLPGLSILFNPTESIPECTFTNVQEGDDDDDADDDDDVSDDDDDVSEVGGVRQPRSEVGGIRGKPGVGTGDGSYVPFTATDDESGSIVLPVLAFLGATFVLSLGYSQWQLRRSEQRR